MIKKNSVKILEYLYNNRSDKYGMEICKEVGFTPITMVKHLKLLVELKYVILIRIGRMKKIEISKEGEQFIENYKIINKK